MAGVTKPVLTNAERDRLLAMPKALHTADVARLSHPAQSRQNAQWEEARATAVAGGERFRVVTNRRRDDHDHFSVTLVYTSAEGHDYVLLRCGSRPMSHANLLERRVIGDPRRCNRMTERYQRSGLHEDGYAEPAGGAYRTLPQALAALCRMANIAVDDGEGGVR
jgi:hypothetical protein